MRYEGGGGGGAWAQVDQGMGYSNYVAHVYCMMRCICYAAACFACRKGHSNPRSQVVILAV